MDQTVKESNEEQVADLFCRLLEAIRRQLGDEKHAPPEPSVEEQEQYQQSPAAPDWTTDDIRKRYEGMCQHL
jgi:hypothetical protein